MIAKPLTAIPKGFGSGGAGLTPNGGGSSTVAGKKPTLEQLLNEHRAALLALQGSVDQGVDVATTANIALTGAQTVDGIALAGGETVLVKSQVTAADNGIYQAAAGAWTKLTEADGSSILKPGMVVGVAEGTTNGSKTFILGEDGTTWTATITASLSSATPAAVAAAGAAGSSSSASKADHAHADPTRAQASTNLTDTATQTIAAPGTAWANLPTLSQGGALTLGDSGTAGDVYEVVRTDVHAFTYAIKDGAGATLFTMPASKECWAKFLYTGTAWVLRGFGIGS